MSLKSLFSFTMTLNFMKVWKYIWERKIKHCFVSFQEGFQQEYTKNKATCVVKTGVITSAEQPLYCLADTE